MICMDAKNKCNWLDEDSADHGDAILADIFPSAADIGDLMRSQTSLGMNDVFLFLEGLWDAVGESLKSVLPGVLDVGVKTAVILPRGLQWWCGWIAAIFNRLIGLMKRLNDSWFKLNTSNMAVVTPRLKWVHPRWLISLAKFSWLSITSTTSFKPAMMV